MTLEQQIVLLFISQAILLIALIISNYVNRRNTATLLKDELKIKKHAEYIERQLAEFYGPISSILHAQGELIRTRFDPDTAKHTDMPDELWQALREEVMIPNAKEIAKIIGNKFHLIEGSEMPQSYRDYIVHAQMWPLRIKLKINSEGYTEKFRFPKDFESEIQGTTKSLKEQYYVLIGHDNTEA
jgi:hypothetical protein